MEIPLLDWVMHLSWFLRKTRNSLDSIIMQYINWVTRFFYKPYFYKQRQAEIGKKLSKS